MHIFYNDHKEIPLNLMPEGNYSFIAQDKKRGMFYYRIDGCLGKLPSIERIKILFHFLIATPFSATQRSLWREFYYGKREFIIVSSRFSSNSNLTLSSQKLRKLYEQQNMRTNDDNSIKLESNPLSGGAVIGMSKLISQLNDQSPKFEPSTLDRGLNEQKQHAKTNEEKFDEWLSNFKLNNDLKTVKRLDIDSSFPIESFQRLVELMPQLESLNFRRVLDVLPKEICQFQELKELPLTRKQLKELPSDLGQLLKLDTIQLGGNRLEKLPESLGNLFRLKNLLLWGNNLRDIPSSFGNLSSLQQLDLSNNQLATLPVSFGNLFALRALNLSKNNFNSIPDCLYALPQLCQINLEGNPINQQEIVYLRLRMADRNYDGPFFYFSEEELQRGDSRPLSFPKLLKGWGYQNSQALIASIDETQRNNVINWLIRLVETEDYKKDPGKMRALVKTFCDWLVEEPQNSQFRHLALVMIDELAKTCGDGVATRTNELFVTMKLSRLDNLTIPHLRDLLIGVKRIDLLKEIAQNHCKELQKKSVKMVDEVEVHLHYQTVLQEKLKLPLFMLGRLYPSGAEEEDILRAGDEVLAETATQEQQIAILAKSPYWKIVLENANFKYAERYQEIVKACNEKKEAFLEESFQNNSFEKDLQDFQNNDKTIWNSTYVMAQELFEKGFL